MANLPARTESPDSPVAMKSLPASIEYAIASVYPDDSQKGPDGRYRRCVTLPQELMPTAAERTAITQHLQTLQRYAGQTAESDPSSREQLLDLIERLCQSLPSQVAGARGIEAATEGYLVAVSDIPVWAVEKALTLWYRGRAHEDGDKFNYTFRPGFHDLRRVAYRLSQPVFTRMKGLQLLLAAEPRRTISDAEREAALARWQEIGARLQKVSREPDPRRLRPGYAARTIKDIADRARRRAAGLLAG